jgi:hypothetical protein
MSTYTELGMKAMTPEVTGHHGYKLPSSVISHKFPVGI